MTLAESLRCYRLQFLGLLLLLAGLYRVIVPEMVLDWYQDPNYSHGFVVPLIVGYFLYQKREELLATEVAPWWPGVLLLALGLLQLLVGWLGTELFTMRTSLVVILSAVALFLFGRGVFRQVWLPLAYLLFMVPLPYILYDAVAFPLKLFVTRTSISFLKAIGVVVLREGNIIILPATTLEVADACSGIRSLISLLALAVAYASYLPVSPARRLFLVLSAIPIAIFANACRVIGTGILAQYWGSKAAEGFFHEFAGLAVFAVAIALLIGLGTFLSAKGKGAS